MNTPILNIDNSIHFGWDNFRKNVKFFLVVCLIYLGFIGISFLSQFYIGPKGINYTPTAYYTIAIIAYLVNIYVSIGLTQECLQIIDNKKAKLNQLFKVAPLKFIRYILLILISIIITLLALAVIFGLFGLSFLALNSGLKLLSLLLLALTFIATVYSIYIGISFSFIRYTFVDKNLSLFQTFKQSYKITNKQKFTIIGFDIAKMLIFSAGLFLLGIGLIFAFPLLAIATAHFYRSLYSKNSI